MRSTKNPRGPRVRSRKDADGREVVRVELNNIPGLYAVFDRDDWARWAAENTSNIHVNDNGHGHSYVRAAAPHAMARRVSLAREIVGAGPGQVVSYLDGDWLNLRRSNLVIRSGAAKRRPLAAFREATLAA